MTRWLESQIETRTRLDSELTERAYAELAASVMEEDDEILSFSEDDMERADSAARACLKSIHVEPGEVPQSTTSVEERLDWLCRPSGTMRRNVKLSHDWQKDAFGSMIGRLDSGEVVALLPYGVRGYCYLDPRTGQKIRITPEVAKHIESDGILFYRPLPAKPLTVTDLVTFIIRVFSRNDYLLVLFAALAVTLIGLTPAWANEVAFGVVAPSGQVDLILPVAALLLGVAVSTALISACRNLIMARMSTKIDVIVEAATFARVLNLPSSFFKQYSSGALASRVSQVALLTRQITTTLLGAGLSALLSLVYIFQIAFYAPMLVLPAIVVVIAQATVTVFSTYITMRYEQRAMEASAKLSGEVTALLGGIQKIKLAGAEDRAFAKWAKGYADYARPAYNKPDFTDALPAVVALFGLIGNIAIFYLAGTSGVGIADYMAFSVAFGQVTAAIMALAGVANELATIRPMFDMVSPVLEATPETAEDKPSVESLSGGIEVSNVAFRYDENLPYVLKNISFKIRPGEYVGIVGRSGCGKSTLLRLLLGFEKPERGSIFYGPYDVTKVNLRSLRSHIGMVMQDGKLFMGDIASNITISSPSATLDDAWEAAELADIADDIRKMPMGMQTFVTEGSGGVSGGQRQRIMIARAICGKRRILMFDEATSALDNKRQKHVSDSLDSLKCTRIVVAHRLSTVRHCDRILVMEDGVIAEEGSYEELMSKGGLFADLVERQLLDREG